MTIGFDGTTAHRRETAGPFLLLGVGLGGLIDGIVLHQILQWHHLLSATDSHPPTTLDGLEANTLADGLFHAASLAAVVVAIALLLRRNSSGQGGGSTTAAAPPRRRRVIAGHLLTGWGGFNVVEGLVDHHLLRLHHVRDVSAPLPWDLGFLVVSVGLVAAGRFLSRPRSIRMREP